MQYIKVGSPIDTVHTRDTGKLNTVNDAKDAIDLLKSNDISDTEKQKALDIVRCAVTILEHKILRIQDLETELQRVRSIKAISSDAVHDLREKLDEANERIAFFENQDINATGT